MDEQWKNWDLRLHEEKRVKGNGTKDDDWRLHIKDLKEGQSIEWNRHGGFYHSPYAGEYRFEFLGAGDTVRLRVGRNDTQEIDVNFTCEWTSGWYESEGCECRITVSITEATYPVSELPAGVRTMQQNDHDAWEYAVRNGLI